MEPKAFGSGVGLVAMVVVCCCLVISSGAPQNVLQIIKDDPQLSEFAKLVENDDLVTMLMTYRSMTVFAPTNDAVLRYLDSVERYQEAVKEHQHVMDREPITGRPFLQYHMSNIASTTDKLMTSLSTDIKGNLPVWINIKTYFNEREIYVNNARIIRKDLKAILQDEELQVLHVIDEVLQPIVAKNGDSIYNNPDAKKFITNHIAFGITDPLSDYSNEIVNSRREQVLTAGTGHTYFFPINRGSTISDQRNPDEKIIDAHIIPNKVLFTRTFGNEKYDSMAYTDMLKVSLTVINETVYSGEGYKLYVQSHSLLTERTDYTTGVVIAQIIKPNIPLKNGVAHLIDRPLVVVDMNIQDFLEREKEGIMKKLYNIFQHSQVSSLFSRLGDTSKMTLFAPSNEAFRRISDDRFSPLLSDPVKLRKMLQLHMVPSRLTSANILRQDKMLVNTQDPMRKLYFRVQGLPYKSLTVEGGGVNASIILADIGATNGVIHIIDRVLGLPQDSLLEKLRGDPDLSQTYRLGQQDYWNSHLENKNKVFTYFVPNNEAWEKVRRDHPSEHKKLLSGEQSYHVRQILERHQLVNHEFNLEELIKRESVQMMKGVFRIKSTMLGAGTTEYWVEWEGERAKIVRPDIETTNGIIHVIDTVLMKRRDLTIGSNSTVPKTCPLTLLGAFLLLLLPLIV